MLDIIEMKRGYVNSYGQKKRIRAAKRGKGQAV